MTRVILHRIGARRWFFVKVGFLAFAILVAVRIYLPAQEGGGDPQPNQENQNLCNGQPYDPNTQGCCNGVIYILATQGCCNGQLYQKATTCCVNNQLLSWEDTDGDGTRDCCYLPTPTYASLLACPGTKKQWSVHQHQYDGCSLPWWLELPLDGDKDNPCGSTTPDTSFYDCCGNPSGPQPSHDQRYQTCGFSKSTADTLMGTCMYNKCAAAGHPSCGLLGLVTCDEYASGYLYGLAEYGEAAYEARQLEYCLCCVAGQ